MRIALALSGGGFRATVFHLGVLARLAEDQQLENVSYLSTVSGGSLCAGLVFALNNYRWPSSQEYRQNVLPAARKLLMSKDLKQAMLARVLTRFLDILDTRADDLSALMQEHWGIKAALKDLPETPRWMINATCYETGKNWRFERMRMGDYVFGYTEDTDLPLTDAMAASAGFPGLIGPLTLETSRRSWFKYQDSPKETQAGQAAQPKHIPMQPPYSPVHLWDGGVYDNHGLEGLHDFVSGWRKDIDFLIVSDAAGRSKPDVYRPGVKALERIITGIMMDQIRSLRARAIVERLVNHGDKGAFLQIGNTCEFVLQQAGRGGEAATKSAACLPESEANLAATMETDIARLDGPTFTRLYRHGYEVADYTMYAYNPGLFDFRGFKV